MIDVRSNEKSKYDADDSIRSRCIDRKANPLSQSIVSMSWKVGRGRMRKFALSRHSRYSSQWARVCHDPASNAHPEFAHP